MHFFLFEKTPQLPGVIGVSEEIYYNLQFLKYITTLQYTKVAYKTS